MPTGYTAELMEHGQTFPEFAMRCARAFGALVHMRDDALDAPIQLPAKSTYHTDAMARLTKEIQQIENMEDSQLLNLQTSERDAALDGCRNALAKDEEENARIAKMRAQVQAWIPPTDEHVGLKEFMLEQLAISWNSTDYLTSRIQKLSEPLAPLSEYRAEKIANLKRDLGYHVQEDAKEEERTDGRKEWVEQLRSSLVGVTVST